MVDSFSTDKGLLKSTVREKRLSNTLITIHRGFADLNFCRRTYVAVQNVLLSVWYHRMTTSNSPADAASAKFMINAPRAAEASDLTSAKPVAVIIRLAIV